jgi:predicted DNA-binding transcriptional regulator AlpA
MINEAEEELLNTVQVLKLIPVSRSTWEKGVKEGHFPKPIDLNGTGRRLFWRKSEIISWIKSK